VRRVFLALLRIVIGVVFIGTGVRKLGDRTASAADFDHWGLPAPHTAVLVISGLEIVCGLLILLGLATRFGALLLCLDMLGAVATAGRIDGGPHLVAPPVLALLCLVLVARGGGRWQLLDRLDPPR
jgi:putative oxidoreductase